MSYCVGISTKYGLAFMSDTRTNAGLDDLSQFKKLFTWSRSDDRLLTILSAGNLATTQAVVSAIDQDFKNKKSQLLKCKSMFEIAEFVGDQLSQKVKQHSENGVNGESTFQANLILGYGRPILVRAYRQDLSMKDIFKLLIVSFDSTLKANLTVGFPLDFQIYFSNTLKSGVEGRLKANDPYFVDVSNAWSKGLEDLLLRLPSLTLSEEVNKQKE